MMAEEYIHDCLGSESHVFCLLTAVGAFEWTLDDTVPLNVASDERTLPYRH